MTTQEAIANKCEQIKNMLLEKNKSYGDSAINPIRIFSKADSAEQLKVRIDDKLSRIARYGDKVEFNGKCEDTINDLIGYLILLSVKNDQDRVPYEAKATIKALDISRLGPQIYHYNNTIKPTLIEEAKLLMTETKPIKTGLPEKY